MVDRSFVTSPPPCRRGDFPSEEVPELTGKDKEKLHREGALYADFITEKYLAVSPSSCPHPVLKGRDGGCFPADRSLLGCNWDQVLAPHGTTGGPLHLARVSLPATMLTDTRLHCEGCQLSQLGC